MSTVVLGSIGEPTEAAARQERTKLFERVAGSGVDDATRANRELVDPAKDRWPSEVLAQSAQPILESLVASVLSGDALSAWRRVLAPDFEGATALRPSALDTLLDNGTFRVKRAQALPGERRAPEELEAQLDAFAELFAGGRDPAYDVRVIAVELGQDGAGTTRATVQASAAVGEGRIGVHFDWTVAWTAREGDPSVAVRSLELAAYEETLCARPPFVEVTRAAIGDHAWFEPQFQQGVGDLYFRNDRLTGNARLGGQGIAVGDGDGDGDDDLYVPMQGGIPNRLLIHGADDTARDAAQESGVAMLDNTRSALFVDLDEDGDQDLALAIGPHVLLCFNQGAGQGPAQGAVSFGEFQWLESVATRERGEREDIFSLAAGDADGDADLDLFACRYVSGGVIGGVPLPYYDADNGASDVFWRNDGRDGEGQRRWTDATAEAGFDANNRKYGLAALWEDFDDDGDADLYVTNDFGRSNFWLNDGGKFRDVAKERGIDAVAASMGVTCADVDLDGRLDLYISNMWSAAGLRIASQRERFQDGKHPELLGHYLHHASGNSLLAGLGGGRFADATAQAGCARGGWSWGSRFVDFDNDGLEDLYVPNGFITNRGAYDLESFFWRRVIGLSPPDATPSDAYRQAWASMPHMIDADGASYNGNERNNVYVNLGGRRFADVSAASGIDFPDDGRSVATVDWNDDGKLDVVLKSRTAPRLRLLINQAARPGNFAAFDLVGTRCNRDAIGARVILTIGERTLRKTIYAGEGYLAQSSKRLHFGLGDAEAIEAASVRWPDGSIEELGSLAVNARYRVVQGSGKAEPVAAKPAAAPLRVETLAKSPLEPHRVVLVEKLPLAKLAIPSFKRSERTIADHAGEILLLHFWSSRGPRASFDAMRADAPALAKAGVRVVMMALDEGATLAKSRKLLAGTPLEADAGYVDGSLLQALEVLMLEIYGRADLVPAPLSMLIDRSGQIAVLYERRLEPTTVARDAATLINKNPADGTNVRLAGGRWLMRASRDFANLASVFGHLGYSELASYFREIHRVRAVSTQTAR